MPIKIRQITIRNYKGIDELTVDFPPPRMSGAPDILVIGSENGLGKTSVLECCALLLLALTLDEKRFELRNRRLTVDIPDLLIRAGSGVAKIRGEIAVDDATMYVQIKIDRSGTIKISRESHSKETYKPFDIERRISDFIKVVCGVTPNPVIDSTFLLFHSYRKVQEGNPELGMMLDLEHSTRRPAFLREEFSRPMSVFKLRILRSLMGMADLFEFEENRKSDKTIEKLNKLVLNYAGGTISKLRPSSDNTVDIRIMPANGGESFTFDGLSSGQKEIISTLFLIWDHTQNNPSVVLIDEPELHLNAQWHRSFIKSLVTLAPQNQYIMATHSEDIMGSVDADRRILLLNSAESGK